MPIAIGIGQHSRCCWNGAISLAEGCGSIYRVEEQDSLVRSVLCVHWLGLPDGKTVIARLIECTHMSLATVTAR